MDKTPDEQDSIRRLLALKRHETPPPGYFRDFSSRVVARIEREEAASPSSWWTRLTGSVAWRPALLGANAIIIAGIGLIALSGISAKRSQGSMAGTGHGQPFAPANAGMDFGSSAVPGLSERSYRAYGVAYQIQVVPAEVPVGSATPSNRVPASILSPSPNLPVMPAAWNDGH